MSASEKTTLVYADALKVALMPGPPTVALTVTFRNPDGSGGSFDVHVSLENVSFTGWQK